ERARRRSAYARTSDRGYLGRQPNEAKIIAMTTQLTQKTNRKVSQGRFYPLGATLDPEGVNFTLFSKHATEVWLCLFDTNNPNGEPTDVIRLENRTRYVFHAHVSGVKAGQLYGYRVRGPFDPAQGHRFNDNKLLIDPYAKALSGKARNKDNTLLAY